MLQNARRPKKKFIKFHANPEPITISTVSEGRYIDVNDSFLRITGYLRGEVIGRTSIELKFWEATEDRSKFIGLLKKHASVRNLEINFFTKSGEKRTGMISGENIDIDGQMCVIAIVQDLTDQKALAGC